MSRLFDSSESRVTYFVDVIIPLPIPNTFTYRVPHKLNDNIQKGMRVLVQFGGSKILTGIIQKIHHDPPKAYAAKYILELLDTTPVFSAFQLDFFAWIADYYMCTMGEVINVALPAGLKVTGESIILLNANYDTSIPLSNDEDQLIRALRLNPEGLTFLQASKFLKIKSVYAIVKSLLRKDIISISEEAKERYKKKKIKKIKLAEPYLEQSTLSDLLSSLDKKTKQQSILLQYLKEIPILQDVSLNEQGIEKSKLMGDASLSSSSLNTLLKKGIFEQFEMVVSRFGNIKPDRDYTLSLTEAQQQASDDIMDLFADKDIVLLHGVTGSGKTEVYIDMINKVLQGGTQVLYLLPEIALTTQIVSRLRKVFGDKLGVYHSRISSNERVEVWNKVLDGEYQLVIGVRSSIFLPFDNLALIIVDEEHDPSYKQVDPAPRYHARDMAIILAHFHHAKVLLGSATPALETYYNAQSAKYGLVELSQRYGDAQLPSIYLIDMKKQKRQGKTKQSFSLDLFQAIQDNIERGGQSILFKNRRGFSPYMICETCAWIPSCTNCNVSLTYHQYAANLRCHYCGHHEDLKHSCEACGDTNMITMGVGTEKIEEETGILFPTAKVLRMDLETTRKKDSLQKIIETFEKGGVDILVGTQMVSKGLDFDRVNLVGIFGADNQLSFPDFRAAERTYQLITQVSGRAGRRGNAGKVIMQVLNVDHPVFRYIMDHDYHALYTSEIVERQKYLYPPYSRLIKLIVKHKEKDLTEAAAQALADHLRTRLGKRILGPEAPAIDRIRNQYLQHILIKIKKKKGLDLKKIKEAIKSSILHLLSDKKYKSVRINIDVDPN